MRVSAKNVVGNGFALQRKSFCGKEKNNDSKTQRYKYIKPIGYTLAALSLGCVAYSIVKGQSSQYLKTLASDMSKNTGKKVSPKNLSSVIGGDDLLQILPRLKECNYVYSTKNAQAGIFRADLHSHSLHSDGVGKVKDILDDAASYADDLYAKTKQKFIFSLTDHDTVDGVKEALEIIASNPQKYKNLQFVPGIEVSFAHKSPLSNNPCEMSELLVYGINPYSEKIAKFVNNIKQKRLNMASSYIDDVANAYPFTKFSFDEFAKYYEFEKYGNVMNIHWRAHHYAQTKHAVTQYANKMGKNPEELYEKLVTGVNNPSIHSLKTGNKLPQSVNESSVLARLFKKYIPHLEDGKVIAKSENTFEEVIDSFKSEKNIFMAFSHPHWYSTHVDNPTEGLKYYTEHSKGLIKASESFHQAYGNVDDSVIAKITQITENLKLLNLGGRDNHEHRLFKSILE